MTVNIVDTLQNVFATHDCQHSGTLQNVFATHDCQHMLYFAECICNT